MKESTKIPCETVINIQLVSGILSNSFLMHKSLYFYLNNSHWKFSHAALFDLHYHPVIFEKLKGVYLSKGYLWIELTLSSWALFQIGSKVSPKWSNLFGNSLIMLGDMINLCLSLHIISIFYLSCIFALIRPLSRILITTFSCFTSYDQIALQRNPTLEQNGGGEPLHCINSPDLSSFMLWDSFIPVKASIIEGQIHRLL